MTLILSPALSGAGRMWEKTAAGVLSLFVLAALIVGGVVIGLVIVKYSARNRTNSSAAAAPIGFVRRPAPGSG